MLKREVSTVWTLQCFIKLCFLLVLRLLGGADAFVRPRFTLDQALRLAFHFVRDVRQSFFDLVDQDQTQVAFFEAIHGVVDG